MKNKYIKYLKRLYSENMQLRVNLILGIVLCVLCSFTSFSGAYAWFTNFSNMSATGFKMATVNLELHSQSDFEIYNFNSSPFAVNEQKKLFEQGYIIHRKGEFADANFTKWCLETDISGDTRFQKSSSPQLMSMSVVRRNYTLKNSSNIPVYFKVDKPVINTPNGMEIALSACWSTNVSITPQAFTFHDGSFFIDRVLTPDVKEITVSYTILVLKLPRVGDTIDINVGYACILQATNNAVFLDEGWKGFAGSGKLKS